MQLQMNLKRFSGKYSALPQTRVICLTVGFFPGLKVAAVPLLQTKTEQFEDKFLKDISECTTSVSGYTAHVGIILFTDGNIDSDHLLQNMDHSMSPETVIVGDRCGEFLCGDDFMDKISKMKCQTLTIGAIALLFMRDRNKPYGIGDIKLHVALSVGLSPVGHMYEVTSVNESSDSMTELTAKREDSDENLDDEAITDTIDESQHTAFIMQCWVGKSKMDINPSIS